MPKSEQNLEECDATGFNSINIAGYLKNIFFSLRLKAKKNIPDFWHCISWLTKIYLQTTHRLLYIRMKKRNTRANLIVKTNPHFIIVDLNSVL